MRERKKRAEDENKMCSIVHENAEKKGLSLVEAEIGRLMHQDEQELLSAWEGWHWDDNKGGWLDPELCAQTRQEEVEHIRRHKMHTRVPREVCSRETGKAPLQDGVGGDRQGTARESPKCAQMGCKGIQDTCQTRTVCVNATVGVAESRAV